MRVKNSLWLKVGECGHIFIGNTLITLQSAPVWPGGQMHSPTVVLQSPNIHCGTQSIHWSII